MAYGIFYNYVTTEVGQDYLDTTEDGLDPKREQKHLRYWIVNMAVGGVPRVDVKRLSSRLHMSQRSVDKAIEDMVAKGYIEEA